MPSIKIAEPHFCQRIAAQVAHQVVHLHDGVGDGRTSGERHAATAATLAHHPDLVENIHGTLRTILVAEPEHTIEAA